MVNELNSSRAFYLDIMQDPQVIADGSFLVTIKSGKNILTLMTPHPLIKDHPYDPAFKFSVTQDFMDETVKKLLNYNVKIFSIQSKDSNQKEIAIIECEDLENNVLIISCCEGKAVSSHHDLEKTQILELE